MITILRTFLIYGIFNSLILNTMGYGQIVLPTLAIPDFQDHSLIQDERTESLQQALPAFLMTTLSKTGQLKCIDRKHLAEVLDELALSQTGLLPIDSVKSVGKLTGAQYLLLGSFMILQTEKVRIDCRVVRTETGDIIMAEEISGKLKDLSKLVIRISRKIIQDLDITLSKQKERELVQSFGNCALETLLMFNQALSLIDDGKPSEALTLLQNILDTCPDFNSAGELLTRLKNTAAQNE